MAQNKLTPAFELLGNTFKTYFETKNIIYVLKVVGMQILMTICLLIPVFLLSILGGLMTGGASNTNYSLGAVVLSLVVMVGFVVIMYWFGAADVVMVNNIADGKVASVKETLKAGWARASRYFGASLVSGVVVLLGYVLLIIPGIIFTVWFAFTHLIAILENESPIESMKKSKALSQGNFLPILGRFLLIGVVAFVISMVLQFIPILGGILIAFISPLFILYQVLLYKNLRSAKESLSPAQ